MTFLKIGLGIDKKHQNEISRRRQKCHTTDHNKKDFIANESKQAGAKLN